MAEVRACAYDDVRSEKRPKRNAAGVSAYWQHDDKLRTVRFWAGWSILNSTNSSEVRKRAQAVDG